MGAVYDALVSLAPEHDPELLKGYERYEALLATLLTPEQLATYAQSIQHSGTLRVFDDLNTDEMSALSADESAIVTAVMANEYALMENRRVASLLNQRGEHDVAPDLDNLPQVNV